MMRSPTVLPRHFDVARFVKDFATSQRVDRLRTAEALDHENELACPVCNIVLSDAARLACGSCAS